jgi:hypothetical protein
MTYLANTDEEKVHKAEKKDKRINETVDNDQSDEDNHQFANYTESDESIIEEFEKIPKQKRKTSKTVATYTVKLPDEIGIPIETWTGLQNEQGVLDQYRYQKTTIYFDCNRLTKNGTYCTRQHKMVQSET